MKIKTITLAYENHEDRIRCAVADSEGNKRVLWLTRRLTEPLVVTLLKHVHKHPPKSVEPQEDAPSEERQARQVYAQLEARLHKKAAEPVEVNEDCPQSLLHEINMNFYQSGAVALLFKGTDDFDGSLTLSLEELRQWLEVLRNTFERAQWRQDIWPEWFSVRKPAN